MKKIALILFMLVPSLAFGAGTSTISADNLIYGAGMALTMRKVQVDLTADSSDASFLPITFEEGTQTTGLKHGPVLGWFLKKIDVDFTPTGTVTPTEGSNIIITQNGVDLLDGWGVSSIINASAYQLFPTINKFLDGSLATGVEGEIINQPIVSEVVTTVTGNSVNSATGTIYFIFSAYQ